MLHRFLYEQADSAVIDGNGLQPDPELTARNLERAKEVIEKMGAKWVFYKPMRREKE